MLSNAIAEKVLGRALSTGGDFAEIFCEDLIARNLMLTSKRIENAFSGRTRGAGIRVFKGTNSVYTYTNDLTLGGLLAAATDAAAAIGEVVGDKDVVVTRSRAANLHPILQYPSDVAGARKVKALEDLDKSARAVSTEISQVSSRLLEKEQHVHIFNSEGLSIEDDRVYTRIFVEAVAASGSENQSGYESPGAFKGFEFVEGLDLCDMGRKAGERAVRMLHAPYCPAMIGPVVIDNGFGGVIFHEACGHALEATSVGKGYSVFCGKLGQAIAAPCVTAVDNSLMPNEWGSLNIDDEGMPTQNRTLIENGVLKSYMIDRMGERRMNLPRTGSGRRQDYTYMPTSRMSNTFICAGQDDDDEMIATMGDGLYAARMGGGSVNPLTGEFNFAVVEGYLVKDGKLTQPVRGATLIGKGSEILWQIDRVGRDMRMGQGMCGSLSGSVPTNVGQPRIRVKSITVGGR